MLRNFRIVLAAIFFIMITLLLFTPVEVLHTWFGWMPGLQLPQSALAQNFIAVVAVVVLTILFGRVYCSILCPPRCFSRHHFMAGRKK